MRNQFRYFFGIFAVALLLASCKASSAEPKTWIDQPLDGSSLPLGVVIIQAHASDADGIRSFEIFVGENKLTEVSVGGKNFEESLVEWQPLAPGDYTIIVMSRDSHKNLGAKAQAHVSIGRIAAQHQTATAPTETSTPSPASITGTLTRSLTPLASMTGTTTPTSAAGACQALLVINANCRSGPSTIFDVKDYLANGVIVQVLGRTFDSGWFFIQNPGSGKQCWLANSTIQIQCDSSQLAIIQPPATPSLTATFSPEAPPVDDQAPIISITSVDPEQIVVQGTSCTDTPQVSTITARVTDASALAWVRADWMINSEQGEAGFSSLGGGNYQVVVGPVNSAGSLAVTVSAQDVSSNVSSTIVYLNVLPCVE